MSIGDKIRELRKLHNLSQETLADILGISTKTLSDYENDKINRPNVHILTSLANRFNVDVKYFLS